MCFLQDKISCCHDRKAWFCVCLCRLRWCQSRRGGRRGGICTCSITTWTTITCLAPATGHLPWASSMTISGCWELSLASLYIVLSTLVSSVNAVKDVTQSCNRGFGLTFLCFAFYYVNRVVKAKIHCRYLEVKIMVLFTLKNAPTCVSKYMQTIPKA